MQVTHEISATVSFDVLLVAVRDYYGNTFTAALNDVTDEFYLQGLKRRDGTAIASCTVSVQSFEQPWLSAEGLEVSYSRQCISQEVDFS